jgi:hypothetical protein
MKPKEQRIAIAELLGWKWIQTNYEAESGLIGTDSPHSGNIPYQGRNYPSNRHLPMYGKAIPDYLNDLNAMREALLTLPPDAPWNYYLSQVIWEENPSRLVTDMDRAQATAAQQARAFLEIKKLWKQ